LALYSLRAILDGFGNGQPAQDEDNAEAHLLRGLIHLELDDRAAAVSALERAVALRPDLVTARIHLARALLESRSGAEAVVLLEGAKKFDPSNAAAHLMLGQAHRLNGSYALAKQELEWVLKHDASPPEAHHGLGLLYLSAPRIAGLTPLAQVDAAKATLESYARLRKKGQPDPAALLRQTAVKRKLIEARQRAGPVP